jgi:uncharacterized protein YecE (DUF72 family)
MDVVRIGTSGWNYPTGRGTWNGVFYPPARSRPRGFDELSFYAEHFNTVEVNSTFYGQPRAEVTSSWDRRTPPGFEFSIKLYQKFTHPRMYKERVAGELPPEARRRDAIDALARPTAADLDEFKRGIEPLVQAGKMGVLLAQFPPSFTFDAPQEAYLAHLLGSLRGYAVAVELRHKSWSDRFGDTLDLLNGFKAAWVQIDEPKFRFSIHQNYLPNIQGVYYMRLHGRNAAQWWTHDKAEDRYNYLYSAEEIREFSDTIDAARRIVKKTYLYTNNHFSAKSVVNAAMIKHNLGEPVSGEYRPEMLDRYPVLNGIVTPASEPTPAKRVKV